MRNLILPFILLLVLFPRPCFSQDALTVFQEAKENAYAQNYDRSIVLLQGLIESHPDNLDYQIFLARVHSWNGSYAPAIAILDPLVREKGSKEALEVMIQTQLWAGNFKEVLRYADLDIAQNPSSRFRFQKARALVGLERHSESQQLISEILEGEPNNRDVLALQAELFRSKKREINFSYLNTSFNNPGFRPWHLASIGAKAPLGTVPVLARVNYGNIFGREGLQLEMDGYPKVNDKSYFYINAGFSIEGTVFPEFRSGLEYFQVVNSWLSFSLGGKFLQFPQNDVWMYTGHLAYTFDNNARISYRPYLADIETIWTMSHSLSIRFPESLTERFFQVDLQYGTVPYEFFTSGTFTNLRTARVGMRYPFRLSPEIFLQPVFMYEYEEYLPDQYRNRFNSQLMASYRF